MMTAEATEIDPFHMLTGLHANPMRQLAFQPHYTDVKTEKGEVSRLPQDDTAVTGEAGPQAVHLSTPLPGTAKQKPEGNFSPCEDSEAASPVATAGQSPLQMQTAGVCHASSNCPGAPGLDKARRGWGGV